MNHERKSRGLTNPGNAQQTLEELSQAISAYEKHILSFPDTPMPRQQHFIDRNEAVQIWTKRAKQWNTAPIGLSVADILFVQQCLHWIATQKCPEDVIPDAKAPMKDLNKLYDQVLALGAVNNKNAAGREETFQECAVEIVFYILPEIDEIQERMAMTFDLGGQSDGNDDLFAASGDKEQIDKKREERQLRDEAAAADLAKRTKNFLPLCSRVFLGLWTEEAIASRWPVSNNMASLPEKHKIAFEGWLREQLPFDPSKHFSERQRNWLLRDNCAINANMFATRNPGVGNRIFTDEEMAKEDCSPDHVTKLLKQAEEKEAKLKASSADPYVRLAMFTSHFDGIFRLGDTLKNDPDKKTIAEVDGGFCAWFVIFRGQLLERLRHLEEDTSFPMTDRRPLIVQICGSWRVHDNETWHLCESVTEALLLWMFLVDTRYKAKLATGQSLREKNWLQMFGF